MCGIVGIASFQEKPILLEELDAMCRSIAHRGPDDDGFYLTKEAGLAMRRLSIIDLSGGRQPISNEDGSVWIVFNGEIYNYRELREGLEKKGHRFSTTTDTEVIVHLYEQYGEECVTMLRGMFGFAVWDDREKTLLLARDRLGIKPLYYAEVGGRLLFASELKAILQISEVERRLDWGALAHAFMFLATPATQAIVEGIKKLEPGHTLLLRAGAAPRIRRYWDVQFEPDHSHNEPYFTERLRDLLEECVSIHLISDVPVGAFLSGGIDSTAVVGLMSRLNKGRVMTFSVGFSETEYSELGYARLAAKKFGTEHYELMLEPNVLDILEDLAWYLDEPFGDSSAIPTYMVSKAASEHVKVVLSGDGGDELFAGYDKYLVEKRERRYGVLAAPLRQCLRLISSRMPDGARGRNFLRHFSLAGAERYIDSLTLFPLEAQKELFADEALCQLATSDPGAECAALLNSCNGNWLSALQRFDLKHYLPLDILTKVDRMSMACSLEVRPPLLDHKLLEFVATIPPELLVQGGRTKHIFKAALQDLLPAEIVRRPKQGFAIPLGKWFRGQLESYVRDLLLSDRARQRGVFRPAYIERLLRMHLAGRNLDLQLWTLISFELWCRTFLDSKPKKGTAEEDALSGSLAVLRPGGLCAA